MTQIEVHKGVAYTVEQSDLTLKAHKGVAYVVEGLPFALISHKGVAYAVEQSDISGNLRQATEVDKPIYRSGPVPYVDFTGDKTFDVNVLNTGSYTLFRFTPEETFVETKVDLTKGPNSIDPDNFNQLAIFEGTPFRIVLEALRVNMRTRIVATSLPVGATATSIVGSTPVLDSPDPTEIVPEFTFTLLSGVDTLGLEGDMTDGDDVLLLEGDMTSGTDKLLVEGDTATVGKKVGLSGDMTDGDDTELLSGT